MPGRLTVEREKQEQRERKLESSQTKRTRTNLNWILKHRAGGKNRERF